MRCFALAGLAVEFSFAGNNKVGPLHCRIELENVSYEIETPNKSGISKNKASEPKAPGSPGAGLIGGGATMVAAEADQMSKTLLVAGKIVW